MGHASELQGGSLTLIIPYHTLSFSNSSFPLWFASYSIYKASLRSARHFDLLMYTDISTVF